MSLEANFRKSFGAFTLDVNFEAGNGIVGLLGASGCGKSMTLKCLAGIVRPDRGRIVVNGAVLFDSEKRINLPPQKRHVGLLFQNYALFPNMTVRQNILSVLNLNPEQNREERLSSLFRRFRLSGLEGHYPSQLSGGQQQRAALARIMAGSPQILLLDEPLSALDSYLRWQLEGELSRILEVFQGTTLFVSHNRDEIYRLCENVCIIHQGRNEPVLPVRSLFEAPGTLASSLLSGCGNYSRVTRLDNFTLRAADWNIDIRSAVPVGDDIRYIGVRGHRVRILSGSDDSGRNVFPCRIVRVVDDIYSTLVVLHPENAPPEGEFSSIRADLPRSGQETPPTAALHPGGRVFVRIAPEDVMLLKP